jgi:FAD dependent oxidoreductase
MNISRDRLGATQMNLRTEGSPDVRALQTEELSGDLAIIGGGLAGVCAAITAARAGVKVVLIQDRPVLGGNASSEVRLWVLGATSHMGNNNRWAREGGVTDELLVENTFRNSEGNPLIFDTILLEKVVSEPNITLLLNTAVFEATKAAPDTITSVRGFCSQNSTMYDVRAPLFCDASGDGVVGFLAGAAFRMGAEARAEFGELWAPTQSNSDLLGHTIYFYSKDTGRPVKFVPPSFALKDITKIPHWRDIKAGDYGCRFWWLEHGGRYDTVHDTETIKWELWSVVYGVWNHIKNSGQFPEAETMALEWVGTLPGKRESRRFEGDYMITQQDVVGQRPHHDAVSFGGWAMDLHPADGVFSEQPGCTQWHSKGVYQIPYRCLYSRNISNLFLAGRIISASHIAFGSTRVMATCAHSAQAVGLAATQKKLPKQVDVLQLQQDLLRVGQFIPGISLNDSNDLARSATISASSELKLSELTPNGETMPLNQPWAMLLPVQAGAVPNVTVILDVAQPTTLRAELRVSSRPDNHTPDVTLKSLLLRLTGGKGQHIAIEFSATLDQARYAFVCLMPDLNIAVHLSDQRLTGVLSVAHNANKAVAKSATQSPPADIGVDTFEFWTPQRRPQGKNFALQINPPIMVFGSANLTNGIARPVNQPNAWVARFDDTTPSVTLRWAALQTVGRIELSFDADFDHPMESALMGHPENVMPTCVRHYRILDECGNVIARCDANHQSRNSIKLEKPVTTRELRIEMERPGDHVPAALFEFRCYAI